MRINAHFLTDAVAASSCAWGDYDNDGFIDLFVTRGSGGTDADHNFLYHNNGDGRFTRVLTGSLASDSGVSFGCAWGDFDNDGLLDLYATGPLLYRNNGNSNGWLTIKLVGAASNRSGIGAKVRVQASIRGRSMWQMREINTGHGAGGASLFAHFGLGDATNVYLARIEWPSGIVQMMTNVPAKQFLTVMEHQEPGAVSVTFDSVSRSTNGATILSVAGDPGLRYRFDASTNLVNWSWLGVRTSLTGNVQFSDATATNFPRRFYRVLVP